MTIHKISLLPFVVVLLLAACQGATQRAPDPTAGEIPTDTSPPPATPTLTLIPEATVSGEQAVMAACTVISPQPTPGPTEQSLFPPVSDNDWVRGPDTADVTIIEYSDFQ